MSLPPLAHGAIAAAVGRAEPLYQAEPVGEAASPTVRLANPAHDLTLEATAAGVQVRAGDAQWRLALAAWGYGEQ
ncbi:MAG: hypothetical protein ACRDIB_08955, partial [Ardenticatenaceae bacterium]